MILLAIFQSVIQLPSAKTAGFAVFQTSIPIPVQNMSNSAHDARNPDVPFGVPDPGTGGEFGGANVEDSVRLPHHAEVQPGTFGAGLASALGFDIKAKESYAEQAGEAATKGAESAKSSVTIDDCASVIKH